jgi:thiol-disulfide isomerase/thioredoxin
MNSKIAALLVFTVGLGAAAAGWWVGSRDDATAAVPSGISPQAVSQLLAQQFPDADGKPQPLSQWRGKTLVVNFWATWCPPCREEMPLLGRTQAEWQSKGVQIVGIGIDEVDAIRKFRDANKLAFPLLVAGPEQIELAQKLGNTAQGLPFTVVIGRDGTLRNVKLGPFRGDQLEKLLHTVTN